MAVTLMLAVALVPELPAAGFYAASLAGLFAGLRLMDVLVGDLGRGVRAVRRAVAERARAGVVSRRRGWRGGHPRGGSQESK
jgi:hypothetical protein